MGCDEVPQVSVVLATHGDANRLAETLQSVLDQQGVSLECLVIADGPLPPAAQEHLRHWMQRDPRLHLIEVPRGGLTKALIVGCNAARGPAIARIDVGDVMLPGRLVSQWQVLQRHSDCVLVSSDVEICGPLWEPIRIQRGVPQADSPRRIDTLPPEQGLAGDVPHHGSVMMRRAAYEQAGGYRAAFYYGQDWDLWYRLAQLGSYAVLSKPLTRCRLFPGGISTRRWREQRRLATCALAAYAARCRGEEDDDWLAEAEAIRPPAHAEATVQPLQDAIRGLRTAGDGAYFIGESLRRTRNVRARHYLLLALRQAPWRPRIWLRLIQALLH